MSYADSTSQWEASGRRVTATVKLLSASHSQEADLTDNVATISYTHTCADKCMTIGTTHSACAEIRLKNVPYSVHSLIIKGKRLSLSFKATYNNSSNTKSLGYFVIDEITKTDLRRKDGNNRHYADLTIRAYDYIYLYANTPIADVTAPNSTTINAWITAMENYCRGQSYGSADSSWSTSSSYVIAAIPEGQLTCRDMLGYLAARQGCICTVNSSGRLIAKKFNASTSGIKTIAQNEQFLDTFEVGGGKTTVCYLESGTGEDSDHIWAYPSNAGVVGQTISIKNPYADSQTVVNQMGALAFANADSSTSPAKFEFYPVTVKWRGNPHIEIAEKILVTDKDGNNIPAFVMNRSLYYDGGMNETYKCYGQNEETISFENGIGVSPLQRTLNAMEQAIKEATDVITQIEGGVFEFIDNNHDGVNEGWKIHSTISNNVVFATQNGIGFGTHGGNSQDVSDLTANSAAIYIDANGQGHINGNYITANSINAEQIQVGGWSSDNYAMGSYYPKYASETSCFSESETNLGKKINLDVNCSGLTDGRELYIYSKPFFAKKNAEIVLSFEAHYNGKYNSSYDAGMYFRIVYSATSNGTYNNVQFKNNLNQNVWWLGIGSSQAGTSTLDGTYSGKLIPSSTGYYRIELIFENCKVNSYFQKMVASAKIDGSLIVNGSVQANQILVSSSPSPVMLSETLQTIEGNISDISANFNSYMAIADYCATQDRTYINGGKIYTGTIVTSKLAAGCVTAEKIQSEAISTKMVEIGTLSRNLGACEWNQEQSSRMVIATDIVEYSGGTIQLVPVSAYISQGQISSSYDVATTSAHPAYVEQGQKIVMKATCYMKAMSGYTAEFELQLFKEGDSSARHTLSFTTSSTSFPSTATTKQYVYTVPSSGKYYIRIRSRYCGEKSYLEKLSANADGIPGEVVINGVIKSTDGNTYFDLNEALIVTEKIRNSVGMRTKYSSGGIQFYVDKDGSSSSYDYTIEGGLYPYYQASNTTTRLWYRNYLAIGQSSDDSPDNFSPSLSFDNNGYIYSSEYFTMNNELRVNDDVELRQNITEDTEEDLLFVKGITTNNYASFITFGFNHKSETLVDGKVFYYNNVPRITFQSIIDTLGNRYTYDLWMDKSGYLRYRDQYVLTGNYPN